MKIWEEIVEMAEKQGRKYFLSFCSRISAQNILRKLFFQFSSSSASNHTFYVLSISSFNPIRKTSLSSTHLYDHMLPYEHFHHPKTSWKLLQSFINSEASLTSFKHMFSKALFHHSASIFREIFWIFIKMIEKFSPFSFLSMVLKK